MKKKNKTFESQLFNAMKEAGLLFPASDQEVENFEKRFGNTKIDVPAELEAPDIKQSLTKKSEPLIKLAAFSKKGKSVKSSKKK